MCAVPVSSLFGSEMSGESSADSDISDIASLRFGFRHGFYSSSGRPVVVRNGRLRRGTRPFGLMDFDLPSSGSSAGSGRSTGTRHLRGAGTQCVTLGNVSGSRPVQVPADRRPLADMIGYG